jgi:hypothetical protein
VRGRATPLIQEDTDCMSPVARSAQVPVIDILTVGIAHDVAVIEVQAGCGVVCIRPDDRRCTLFEENQRGCITHWDAVRIDDNDLHRTALARQDGGAIGINGWLKALEKILNAKLAPGGFRALEALIVRRPCSGERMVAYRERTGIIGQGRYPIAVCISRSDEISIDVEIDSFSAERVRAARQLCRQGHRGGMEHYTVGDAELQGGGGRRARGINNREVYKDKVPVIL